MSSENKKLPTEENTPSANETKEHMRRRRPKPQKQKKNTPTEKKTAATPVSEDLKKPINKTLVTVVSIVAAVFLCVLLILCGFAPTDTVANGVTLNGIDLSGMTLDEVKEVAEASTYYDDISITIKCMESVKELEGNDFGLTADSAATAEKAMEIGKSGNKFADFVNSVKLRVSGVDINPVPTADYEALDALLYEFGESLFGEMTEPTCEIEDSTARIKLGSSGQDHDVEKERKALLAELENGNFHMLDLGFKKSSPEVLTADSVYMMLYSEPKDASYEIVDGELVVVDEVIGYSPDKDEISKKLSALNSGEEVSFSLVTTQPTQTAADIEKNLFADTLASYSSTYSGSGNRTKNLARAAASCNGTILLPGEIFSYNGTIGNPSKANGYLEAPIFENGKTSTGVGGGVCQISSTIYSAALYADLEIVERRNHSLIVTYVPKGQDATVSYGAIDFKFKNNTEYPIKLNASASGGKVSVSILGTKTEKDKKVEIINTVVSTTSPTRSETLDPSMPSGTTTVTSAGKTGYVVDSVRKVYQNGVEIRSESLGRSTYRMVPTEVLVGAAPTETESPEETAEPTTAPDNGAIDEDEQDEKPTSAPTKEPTEEPESEPTKEPTSAPTKEPTPEAENDPTPEPTKEPSPEVPEEAEVETAE